MAAPVTEEFEEMVLEVEFDPVGSPGTYTKICGISGVTISRTSNISSTEVPGDCDDDSVPMDVVKRVRSLEVSASGTGTWARGSQGKLKTWYYSGTSLNVRLSDTAAASGDIEIESGPALLATLGNERVKGEQVSAEIELQFATTPTRTNQA